MTAADRVDASLAELRLRAHLRVLEDTIARTRQRIEDDWRDEQRRQWAWWSQEEYPDYRVTVGDFWRSEEITVPEAMRRAAEREMPDDVLYGRVDQAGRPILQDAVTSAVAGWSALLAAETARTTLGSP